MPGPHTLRSVSSSNSTSSSSSTHHHAADKAPQSAAASHQRRHGLVPASRALPTFQMAANPLIVVPFASHTRLKHITTDPSTDPSHLRLHDASPTIANYSSSGSPHHGPSTVCLSAMVHEFLEQETRASSCGRARCNCADGVCSGDDDEKCAMAADEPQESLLPDDHLCEILEGIASCSSKPELLLLVDVARAVEMEAEELKASATTGGDDVDGGDEDDAFVFERLRRPVMNCLRQEGYNAAICKSRWKHADGIPAGDYEYIDIVMDGGSKNSKQERFIVDIDFRSQFEIARASKQYVQLLGVLPRLFVGRAERLKQILKIMSNAAKCSLKQQGLLLPPWRKHKYMQAKWFSPYRRTTNLESLSSSNLKSSQHLLQGLGLRAPIILSLDFTKEMDLLFYKAQVKGLNNQSQHHFVHKRETHNATNGNDSIVRTGVLNDVSNSLEYPPLCSKMYTTARCTDWQLPPLDEKHRRAGTVGRVSGISTALKQASFLSNKLSSQIVAS